MADILQRHVYVLPIFINPVFDINPFVLRPSTHADIAIAWSGQLLYDFVVFLLTLVGSLRMRKEGSRSGSVIHILLRDGVSIDLTLSLRLSPINR